MAEYCAAYEPDLRCNPNYSFAVGDVDGDGRMEFVALNQSGSRLRCVNLDGDVLFENQLRNHGNWGTPLIAAADWNGDGKAEVLVPNSRRGAEAAVELYDRAGRLLHRQSLGTCECDDFGIAVPLLTPFRHESDAPQGMLIALAGGVLICLDHEFREVWRRDGLEHDFGHEFHPADIDADGRDEVAFCTLPHINGGKAANQGRGKLVLLDHEGTTLLERKVTDYCDDTHFDDVAMADFLGDGRTQICLEKGLLIDLEGNVIWDVSGEMNHGQWIAHVPNPDGHGRVIFISELWNAKAKACLISPDGRKLADMRDAPWTQLDKSRHPGCQILPTRAHVVQWSPDEEPELFVGEQVAGPRTPDCFADIEFDLKGFFLDLRGELIGAIPVRDTQKENYWYNGEVHSCVCDADGDGAPEIVWPQMDGRVLVIKRRM